MKPPINAINNMINQYGRLVQVTTRTPTENGQGEIVKDNRGHVVYNEEINTITARIKVMRGGERLVRNNILQVGDAVGIFKLSDAGTLNEQSYLFLQDVNTEGYGQSFNFKIEKPVHKQTHIEANLKRSEL